jgi:hypothetical protein
MRPQLSHRTKNHTLRSNADWLAISSDSSNADHAIGVVCRVVSCHTVP